MPCTTDCMPVSHLERKFHATAVMRLPPSCATSPGTSACCRGAYKKKNKTRKPSASCFLRAIEEANFPCAPNEGGSVKRRPAWMNEHVPADRGRSRRRERSGLLSSPAQRWLRGHRGQHDPCDPHVTPLFFFFFFTTAAAKGQKSSSASLKFPENHNTRVPALPLKKKSTFLFIDTNTYVFRFANS